MIELALMFLTGLVAGTLGSMLGMGGGFIIIPVFTIAFGLPIRTAVAASLISIIANSSSSAATYLKAGLPNARLGLLLLVPTVIGAVAGGLVATRIDERVLAFLFAAFLFYISFTMIRGKASTSDVPVEYPQVAAKGERKLWQSLAQQCVDGLTCTFYDRRADCQVTYQPQRVAFGLSTGLLAGVMSGLLGIGGGVIQVSIMNVVMRMPLRAAIATSSYMVGITALASAFIYFGNGYVDPAVTVLTVIGIFLGAKLGARIAQTLRTTWLSRLIAVILFYSALQMLLNALGARYY